MQFINLIPKLMNSICFKDYLLYLYSLETKLRINKIND